MDAIIHNDRKGPIGYRIRGAFGEPGEPGYLNPGPNPMPLEKVKAILASPHHQPTSRFGKPDGKPVTNGTAWREAGWTRVEWPEPEEPRRAK